MLPFLISSLALLSFIDALTHIFSNNCNLKVALLRKLLLACSHCCSLHPPSLLTLLLLVLQLATEQVPLINWARFVCPNWLTLMFPPSPSHSPFHNWQQTDTSRTCYSSHTHTCCQCGTWHSHTHTRPIYICFISLAIPGVVPANINLLSMLNLPSPPSPFPLCPCTVCISGWKRTI